MQRLRNSLNGAKLIIGVDRLDYSKGLSQRIQAFDRLLTQHPDLSRKLSMLQIAVPSRCTIDAYRDLQRKLPNSSAPSTAAMARWTGRRCAT